MKRGKISERISVGGQPTEDDIKLLRAEGFVGIINLRRDGEQNQPLSPAEQGLAVAAAGLKYVHIPVNSADPKHEQVVAVKKALDQINGPVFVHCQGGGRACTMALLASEPNSTPEQMMKQAEASGFPVTNPVSVQFVNDVLGRKS
jgi:uncharacterized protein (TIGR01244 family)